MDSRHDFHISGEITSGPSHRAARHRSRALLNDRAHAILASIRSAGLLRLFAVIAMCAIVLASHCTFAQPELIRNQISDLFNQAQAAEQAGNEADAVAQYRQILKLSPDLAEVWSNLGVDLFQMQHNQEAISALERAAALKPSLLAPHLFLGKIYLDRRQPQKAIPSLKAALAINPSEPETLLALGDAYSQVQEFRSAVRLLEKADRLTPGTESITSQLAVTFLEWAKALGSSLRLSSSIYGRLITDQKRIIERPDIVENELNDTLTASPQLTEARLNMVDFLFARQSDPRWSEKCGTQITEGLRLEPHNPALLAAAVRLAVAIQNFASVEKNVDELALIDPAFALANSESITAGMPGDLKSKTMKQFRSAVQAHRSQTGSYSMRVAELNPLRSRRLLSARESEAFSEAAWYLHQYRDGFEQLISRSTLTSAEKYWLFRICAQFGKQILDQTVSAHPESVRTHLLLADFALQQNKNEDARAEYRAALQLQPDNPEILLIYARFLESTGEFAAALEAASHGLAIAPHHAELNFEAGHLTLLSGGDTAAGSRYFRQALAIDPGMFQAHVELAKVDARLGRIDDAAQEIAPVLDHDEDGSLHFLAARWYRQLGKTEDARKALEKSEQLKRDALQKEVKSISGAVQ